GLDGHDAGDIAQWLGVPVAHQFDRGVDDAVLPRGEDPGARRALGPGHADGRQCGYEVDAPQERKEQHGHGRGKPPGGEARTGTPRWEAARRLNVLGVIDHHGRRLIKMPAAATPASPASAYAPI